MSNTNEKVVVKSVNLGCLLLALVLTVLAIFSYYTLTSSDLEIGGMSLMLDDIGDFEEMIENEDFTMIFGMIFCVVCSIMMIVMAINVLILVIGWFGFIGKKDSRKMALKLSKHAKKAFGVAASAITVHMIAAADDGIFAGSAKLVMIITGVLALITYLAVRYYRWFVVEKVSPKAYVFQLIKDAMFIVLPIVLLSIMSPAPIGEFLDAMAIATSGVANTPYVNQQYMRAIFNGFIGFIYIVCFMGVVSNTLKYLPFDNYKRSAASRLAKNYITVIITPLIMMVMGAFATMMITTEGDFDTDLFVECLMNYVVPVVKMIVLAIAAGICAKVGSDDDYTQYKVAVKAEAAPAAEAAAAPVAAEGDENEPVEEGAAEEEVMEEEISEEEIDG